LLDIPILLNLADSLRNWLGFLSKEKTDQNERERKALKALYAALMETSMYFRRLDSPHLARTKREQKEFQRDIAREEALARLWTEASVELRDVDEDLATRCFFKAQYWTNRDAWTAEDVHNANIALQRVTRDAQALLRKPA